MCIFYKSGYKYQLCRNYTINTGIKDLVFDIKSPYIDLSKHGMLTIRAGYAWDGATCAIDTKNFMRGSLVHDALYQLIDEKYLDQKYRLSADKLLFRILRADGMGWFRSKLVYFGVRIFGEKFMAQPNPVLIAP